MLSGIDPILIFNLFKVLTPADEAKFKGLSVAGIVSKFALPPIPLYLSEKLTGIFVDTEEKSIEVATSSDGLSGGGLDLQQKAISTSVKINMIATEGTSLGLGILSAMADIIVPKLTTNEYSIIYIHRSTIILNGRLHHFSIEQDSGSTLSKITLELINGPLTLGFAVPNDGAATSLNNAGSAAPAGGAAGSSIGSGSGPIPQASVPIGPLG